MTQVSVLANEQCVRVRVRVRVRVQVSVLAKEAKKPFYVAAESYKFCRLYPLR